MIPITYISLGDAVELINGDRGKNYPDRDAQRPSGHCLFLSTKNVRHGHFDFSEVAFIDEKRHAILGGGSLKRNDIVLTIRGTLGNTAVFHEGIPYDVVRINSAMLALRPNRNFDPDFIERFLRSNTFLDWVGANQRGSAQPHLRTADIETAQLPLFSKKHQQKLVSKIDSLSGKSRRTRERLEHIPRLVEKYKQAILAAAFRGELTQVWREAQPNVETADQLVARTLEPPQSRGGREATTSIKPGIAGLSVNDPGTAPPSGWSWVNLRRIARQETGHTPRRSHPDYWDGNIPWIGIVDAGNHHGQIINDTLQTISEKGLANSSTRLLPAGTVCLSRTASVGYVTIMGRPMCTSQDFATWSCSPALIPKYLMYALMAEGDSIRDFGEGSTHTTIYFLEIRALHICLAPLIEQQEIIRRIESALVWVDMIASETKSARKLVDHLDQAILSKAFRGELVPQDPNDEPASVLLERIKVDREANSSKRLKTMQK